MNKQEKLAKLIEIAKKNGFELLDSKHVVRIGRNILGEFESISAYEIILFSHDFANAIWGNEDYPAKSWRYHLQMAVISEDPLEYYWNNK